MKGFFVVAAVLLLLLSSAANAKAIDRKNLLIGSVVVVGDASFVSVSVSNDDSILRAEKVVVVIPELGLRAAKRVDVKPGGRRFVVLSLSDGISKKGDYYASLIAESDGGRRITHRVVTVE